MSKSFKFELHVVAKPTYLKFFLLDEKIYFVFKDRNDNFYIFIVKVIFSCIETPEKSILLSNFFKYSKKMFEFPKYWL